MKAFLITFCISQPVLMLVNGVGFWEVFWSSFWLSFAVAFFTTLKYTPEMAEHDAKHPMCTARRRLRCRHTNSATNQCVRFGTQSCPLFRD